MEAERDVAHGRTHRLTGNDGIVDRRRGRKDAGEERVQRAAIIRVPACACVRSSASVVSMAVSVLAASLMLVGVVVAGMRSHSPDSRMGLRERRRNDPGELGDQKQGDQKPNRARLCPEPLHDSSGRSGGERDFRPYGRERQSLRATRCIRGERRSKSAENRAPDGSCAECGRAPSLARLSRLKTPRAGRKTWRRLRDAHEARPFFVRPLLPLPAGVRVSGIAAVGRRVRTAIVQDLAKVQCPSGLTSPRS